VWELWVVGTGGLEEVASRVRGLLSGGSCSVGGQRAPGGGRWRGLVMMVVMVVVDLLLDRPLLDVVGELCRGHSAK